MQLERTSGCRDDERRRAETIFRVGGSPGSLESSFFVGGVGGFYECLDRCRYASQVIDEHIDVLATQ